MSRAIILAGGSSASLIPLTDTRPKALLPVVNRPLIEWQIQALHRSGIEEVGIALSPDNIEPVSRHLESRNDSEVRLHFAVDEVPRGPAGGIKLFEGILDGETFLVLDGGTFLGDVRIDALIRAHQERGAVATMAILPQPVTAPSAQAVVAPDGTIEGIFQLHYSSDRRRSRSLAGLSIFDSSVLGLIPESGYSDVKERLFSELQKQGALVVAETTQERCVPIDSIQRYYQLQAGLMEGDFEPGESYRQVADGVWIGEGAELAPSVYVLGPLLIGRDCRIEEGAQLIGPAVIGDGSRVGSRSVVRGSILWERSQLAAGCKVENSVVASSVSVSGETWLRGAIAAPANGREETTSLFPSPPPSPRSAPAGNGVSWITAVGKALMDYVGAGLLLALSSPILLLCALGVRLSSPGPVLFRQLRCGRDGNQFWMLKLRTMVDDADDKQVKLRARNDSDGPVFKMYADPRVTGFGGLLRRTSLDELPQLLNVLRGEMSLVGPRPLAAKEMRYCPAWRDRRLSVKPGITGLWQVSGRSRARFHDWIQYDIDYVKRQSIGLDLRILARTVVTVVRRSGAC